MKNNITLIIFSIGIFLVGLFYSCTNNDSKPIKNIDRKSYRIDLFSKDKIIYDNVGKLSLEDAFSKSKLVIKSSSVEQISNSNTRTLSPFYIYQVNEGDIKKSLDSKKYKFPILFVSKQELFRGKKYNDTVNLFLIPVKEFKLLKQTTNVNYEWLYDAPFFIQ